MAEDSRFAALTAVAHGEAVRWAALPTCTPLQNPQRSNWRGNPQDPSGEAPNVATALLHLLPFTFEKCCKYNVIWEL
ncbi:hypothetical protein [Dendronalium sp. ChiSLP03b]|uniref:hypothetical protein n=1 Tax=Dendronalium sp. ChiSLP03b TaxID=3075381 RepID=UPI002AD4B58C|nr:hypothetical protein [Dendronalium sp. ChiSLP03b]MDZ8206090.1 hypothetical protein [Dendronalium sp. ChiSLP03b]